MAELGFDLPQFHDSIDDITPPCATQLRVGHDQSCAFMLAAAKGGHHALILDGERGIGKATAAFHLANFLLANDDAAKTDVLNAPDVETITYRQIAQNVHPNLLYLTRPLKDDGKGFKTVITVDEVRRLHRFLGMSASGGSKRVVVIDCLADMNRNAANAVLKLLEEPPHNTLFLLISHGMGGLLPTIRSRCQIVRFSSLETKDVETTLNQVASSMINSEEATKLAALSGGSVRHALMMARSGGLELRDTLNAFLDAPNFDTATAHKLADVAGMRGSDEHNQLLRELVLEAVQKGALSSVSAGEISKAEKFSRFSAEFGERTRVADGFNLDRRQEFLITANQLHTLFYGV
ncbi:MAG: DNA polymerase III subunit delta' [Pseudomonadota bacterium]